MLFLACTREAHLNWVPAHHLQARQHRNSACMVSSATSCIVALPFYTGRAVHMAPCMLGDFLPGHPAEHTAFLRFVTSCAL